MALGTAENMSTFIYSLGTVSPKGLCSPGVVGLDLDPTDEVFSLQILVAQVVPIVTFGHFG